MNEQGREKKFKASASAYVTIGIAIVFTLSAASLFFVVNSRSKNQVLKEAEAKAQRILQRSLAVHTYFSHNLKPKISELSDRVRLEESIEPSGMSSFFSFHEIDNYFKSLNNDGGYYYKECALNARSPENEADEIERAFINELNDDPQLQTRSGIRQIDNEYFFVSMHRGEVIEKSCLRCHNTLQGASKELKSAYDSTGNFSSTTGDVVSAVSIRLPLADEYKEAAISSRELSWILVAVLFCLFIVQYFINKFVIIRPIQILRSKILALVNNEDQLEQEISLPMSREMSEVVEAFNILSKKMRFQVDNLEETVDARTSELKDTIKELRESEQRYRLLVEHAIEGICVIQDGFLKFYSPRVSEVTGYSAYELSTMPFIDLVHPDDREDVINRHVRRLAGEDFSPLSHFRIIEKSGDVKWLEDNTVLIDWDEAPATLGFVYDITDRKQMEDQLFLSEKMSIIAGLAAGVAHEINTPLSAILQSSQVVQSSLDKDSPGNQQIAEKCGVDLEKVNQYFKEKELDFFIDGIKTSAINASIIIKNLLEFSRPKKGEMKRVNINELIDKSLVLSRSDYNLKKRFDIINVNISKEYASKLPQIMCVPMEIEQVLINLLRNSVHAMADNAEDKAPHIIIRTELKDETVHIELEDNGPGIAEEVRKKIFDPFFTTKEVGVGTGLGLSISYAIIREKHKGSIWVESEEGRGAKFVIELPLKAETDE